MLERSGAPEPDFLPHVMLRASRRDADEFPITRQDEPIREVGLAMARGDLDLVPIVDDDGALVGVVTERALARRYIRESRQTSTLGRRRPASARSSRCSRASSSPARTRELAGRVWVHSMDVATAKSGISDGDVVVVGNRADAQRLAIELGAALLVTSNGAQPDRRGPGAGRASAARRSSSRRSTPTSRAG